MGRPRLRFYAVQQGEAVACARILMRRDGPLECEEHFSLERFGRRTRNTLA